MSEIWVQLDDGQSMCAFIADRYGFLMYLRFSGDAGFTSRNPNYCGSSGTEISYMLQNGQVDSYPASWAIPIDEVQQSLEYFRTECKRPPWITWHDDSDTEE